MCIIKWYGTANDNDIIMSVLIYHYLNDPQYCALLGRWCSIWVWTVFLRDGICIPLQSVSELDAYVDVLVVRCLYFKGLRPLFELM